MTLLDAAKEHWKHYVPMWLFSPAFFLLTQHAVISRALFLLLLVPTFFAASIWAMLPWLRRKVGYWPSLFWSMLVPAGSWILLVATMSRANAA